MAGADTPGTVPQLAVSGGIATITLNRPAHRNRLEPQDLQALLAHFETVNADPAVRVVGLQANTAGQPRPVFCAGYHLGGFDDPGADPRAFARCADAWAELRPITVCVLNGSVYGGATDFAVASDLRLAQTGMELRMPAAALGLHYYPSGLRRAVARLGLPLSNRIFLTARPLGAEQLERAGVLEALVPPDSLPQVAGELMAELAALAPLAAQGMKASLREIALGIDVEPTLSMREALCAGSEDFVEGRNAFAQRRSPRFEGR